MTVFVLPDIIDGITEYCEKEDYQILLVNLRLYKKFADKYYRDNSYKDIVHQEIKKLQAKQVEGIIYVAGHERYIDVIPEDLPLPTVVAYSFSGKKEIPSVVVDDVSGARDLTAHLIENGHRKIGVLAGKRESIHTRARLEGYQRALFSGGILYNPELVVYGEWDRESGYRNAERIIEKGCTAIFCMNDFIAGGTYDRLYELGIQVGRDIAVAGYDNREMANYEKPPLTTMGLPLHDIGYRASEFLLNILQGKELEAKDGVSYVKCCPLFRESVNKIEG